MIKGLVEKRLGWISWIGDIGYIMDSYIISSGKNIGIAAVKLIFEEIPDTAYDTAIENYGNFIIPALLSKFKQPDSHSGLIIDTHFAVHEERRAIRAFVLGATDDENEPQQGQ
jgi:hypothetical protein